MDYSFYYLSKRMAKLNKESLWEYVFGIIASIGGQHRVTCDSHFVLTVLPVSGMTHPAFTVFYGCYYLRAP
jgi:hypothetical protein